jgi:predicted HAD superfamily Cof-like phosphohydrolase
MNPFQDQAEVMKAYGQTVGFINPDQGMAYYRMMIEEMAEYQQAFTKTLLDVDYTEEQCNEIIAEIFDGCIDLIVVTIGFMHSMGLPVEAGWREVMQSNLSKIDPETGFVKRREDGKVLKPAGYKPPDLLSLIKSTLKEAQ